MLDAGVDLRDVQIAARHADPRTTMRPVRARQNLDRHPNYILAAYMASGTFPNFRHRGLGSGGRLASPVSEWALGAAHAAGAGSVRPPAEALTPTEIKIAALVAGGDSTSDIARGMFVSRRTVQTHISRILAKLGAKGRVEIVREALRQGRLALAGRTNRRRCGKVSSHDHYSQPGAAGCLGLCPVLGTGQAAGRDMRRMTQPGLLWASVRRRRITSATLPGDATWV